MGDVHLTIYTSGIQSHDQRNIFNTNHLRCILLKRKKYSIKKIPVCDYTISFAKILNEKRHSKQEGSTAAMKKLFP